MTNDYTVHYHGRVYQIDRQDIRVGMRKGIVRMEERLDGSIAVRFQDKYLRVHPCALSVRESSRRQTAARKPPRPAAKRKSDWMKGFSILLGPFFTPGHGGLQCARLSTAAPRNSNGARGQNRGGGAR